MYNIWIESEIIWLKNNYKNTNIKECEKILNRTTSSIKAMANRLGLKQEEYWTEKEIKILKKYYPLGIHECVTRLNRRQNSIIQKAFKLNLSVLPRNKNINNSNSKRKIWDKKKHKIIPALQKYWKDNKKEKGYIYINKQGYKMIKDDSHPNCNNNGYVKEHTYIMSSKLNRKIKKNERIHHIDCDKLNNNINNLYLCNNEREHQLAHTSIYPLIKELIKKDIVRFENGKYMLS